MGIEIERRFLLKDSSWREETCGVRHIIQIYLSYDPVVRVRTYGFSFDAIDFSAVITIKGERRPGSLGKQEIEWKIPRAEAKELLLSNLRKGAMIIKDRYHVIHEGLLWEIDEFQNQNNGLIIAEIELTQENQEINLPPWVGEEITDDHRYANSSLSQNPYENWM